MSPTESIARAKVWLEKDGKPLVGKGRAELLETIQRTGSIRKAASQMGFSYRHAWDIISKIGRAYGSPVVVSKRGGRGGGSTDLTDAGRRLLEMYRSAEKASEAALSQTRSEEFIIVSTGQEGRLILAVSRDDSRKLTIRMQGKPMDLKPGERIVITTLR